MAKTKVRTYRRKGRKVKKHIRRVKKRKVRKRRSFIYQADPEQAKKDFWDIARAQTIKADERKGKELEYKYNKERFGIDWV